MYPKIQSLLRGLKGAGPRLQLEPHNRIILKTYAPGQSRQREELNTPGFLASILFKTTLAIDAATQYLSCVEAEGFAFIIVEATYH